MEKPEPNGSGLFVATDSSDFAAEVAAETEHG